MRLAEDDAERLMRERDEALARAGEREAFLRDVLACRCTADEETLRDARLSREQAMARAQVLDDLLARAEVASPGDIPLDVVTLGSTFEMHDLETDATWWMRVVPAADVEVVEDAVLRMSDVSPLGAAVLGTPPGGVVEVRSASGSLHAYRVGRIGS